MAGTARTLDDVEEFESTITEYGGEVNTPIGEHMDLSGQFSNRRAVEPQMGKDLSEREITVDVISQPVGPEGPDFNVSFADIDYRDNNEDESYNVQELKATISGEF